MTDTKSVETNQITSLKASIERFVSLGEVESKPEARRAFLDFRDHLTTGKIRAAEKVGGQSSWDFAWACWLKWAAKAYLLWTKTLSLRASSPSKIVCASFPAVRPSAWELMSRLL
jgi:hypothetical protein